jgi:transketolase
MKAMRDQFGESLVERGEFDENLVVLDADLSSSTRTEKFQQRFPRRFFNFGIAEQNMVGAAVGMALRGKNVVLSGFTIFTIGRAWDFIRLAAYDEIPIKICTTHAGLSAGLDGATHQILEDLALTCVIPNLNVIIPADSLETKQIMEYVLDTPSMFFVRLGRNPVPDVIPDSYKYEFGKCQEVTSGDDVTIFACGNMVHNSIEASKMLLDQGIRAQVINVSTLKPLDSSSICDFVTHTGCAVVAEEHNVIGGLGAEISRVIAQNYPVPIEFVAVEDKFGQSGSDKDLFEYYGLTPEFILQKTQKVLERKGKLHDNL